MSKINDYKYFTDNGKQFIHKHKMHKKTVDKNLHLSLEKQTLAEA